MASELIFVDANIFLDFYRGQTGTALALLRRLKTVRRQLVTSFVVQMEFEKNRQKLVRDALRAIVKTAPASIPAFLSERRTSTSLVAALQEANKRTDSFRELVKHVLVSPGTHDAVYRTVGLLFGRRSDLNLRGDDQRCAEIQTRALNRFMLGYPPRKKTDTSIGDAVNWEWIIASAKRHHSNVTLVSRDSDFGVNVDGDSFLNDWLSREFRSRVSSHASIRLVTRLSDALKRLSVHVTDRESQEEDEIIQQGGYRAEERDVLVSDLELERILQMIEKRHSAQ